MGFSFTLKPQHSQLHDNQWLRSDALFCRGLGRGRWVPPVTDDLMPESSARVCQRLACARRNQRPADRPLLFPAPGTGREAEPALGQRFDAVDRLGEQHAPFLPTYAPLHTAGEDWRFDMGGTEGRARSVLLMQNPTAHAPLVADELDPLTGAAMCW